MCTWAERPFGTSERGPRCAREACLPSLLCTASKRHGVICCRGKPHGTFSLPPRTGRRGQADAAGAVGRPLRRVRGARGRKLQLVRQSLWRTAGCGASVFLAAAHGQGARLTISVACTRRSCERGRFCCGEHIRQVRLTRGFFTVLLLGLMHQGTRRSLESELCPRVRFIRAGTLPP